MLNYVTMRTADLKTNPTAVFDVISDAKSDLDGLSLTLSAIAEQPHEIEPSQLFTLSNMVWFMADALGDVLLAMREERETAKASISIAALAAERESAEGVA